MKWKKHFNLSISEKRGFVVLASIMLLLIAARIVFIFRPNNPPDFVSTLPEELAQWEAEQQNLLRVAHRFNPNQVDSLFLSSLHISSFAQKNWLRFLARGNRFSSPKDVQEIYGLDSVWFFVNQDSLQIINSQEKSKAKTAPVYFEFDPNKVSKNEMLELGFPEWLAQRMLNFRKKGGAFKTPADVQQIYDFPQALFHEIEPYIVIESTDEKAETHDKETDKVIIVELNSADSLQLIQVNGVGPVFAHRILAYRKRLGGYASITQLKEVYGIDEEKFKTIKQQFTVDSKLVHTLNINTATFKELVNHPYLNYEQVKSIVGFREMMRPFKTIDELSELGGFSAKEIELLKGYLRVE